MRSTVHMTTHKSQVMNAASVKWGRVTQIVHNAIISLPGTGKLAAVMATSKLSITLWSRKL